MSAVTLADIARAAVEQGLDAEAVTDRLFEHGPTATDKYALRDYFAGKALPALLEGMNDPATRRMLKDRGVDPIESAATGAYAVADAMLKARFA